MKYCLSILLVGFYSCGIDDRGVNFSEFSGNWSTEAEGITFCEDWGALSDEGLIGIGYQIEGDDTLCNEKLSVYFSENEWIYEATVFEQNNCKPIEFVLTDTLGSFVFENPQHDFPKKITYNFSSFK